MCKRVKNDRQRIDVRDQRCYICCYNELGPGLLESVYEEALVYELKQRGLDVARQVEVPIIYKGSELKTLLRLDLLVNDQVIVELKSVEEMKSVFAKQLLTYLKLMGKRVGL